MFYLDDKLCDIRDYITCLFKTRTAYRVFKKDAYPDSNTIIGCVKCKMDYDSEIDDVWSEDKLKMKNCPFCGIKLVFIKEERGWINKKGE